MFSLAIARSFVIFLGDLVVLSWMADLGFVVWKTFLQVLIASILTFRLGCCRIPLSAFVDRIIPTQFNDASMHIKNQKRVSEFDSYPAW